MPDETSNCPSCADHPMGKALPGSTADVLVREYVPPTAAELDFSRNFYAAMEARTGRSPFTEGIPVQTQDASPGFGGIAQSDGVLLPGTSGLAMDPYRPAFMSVRTAGYENKLPPQPTISDVAGAMSDTDILTPSQLTAPWFERQPIGRSENNTAIELPNYIDGFATAGLKLSSLLQGQQQPRGRAVLPRGPGLRLRTVYFNLGNCGQFAWNTRWELSGPAPRSLGNKKTWIFQNVLRRRKVIDCDTGLETWWNIVYTEAWEVEPGQTLTKMYFEVGRRIRQAGERARAFDDQIQDDAHYAEGWQWVGLFAYVLHEHELSAAFKPI